MSKKDDLAIWYIVLYVLYYNNSVNGAKIHQNVDMKFTRLQLKPLQVNHEILLYKECMHVQLNNVH